MISPREATIKDLRSRLDHAEATIPKLCSSCHMSIWCMMMPGLMAI